MTKRRFVLATLALLAAAGCKRSQPLPELGSVPAFEFRDQRGESVTHGSLRGKPWVAAFMFTRCPTVCPKITLTMRQLQERAREQSLPVHWVSFTVDPENDTPEVLAAYVREYELDASNWSFLTGDSTRIRQTAEQGFKIALEGSADPEQEHFGISHGSHLVLVDARLKIRGYYRTTDEHAQQELLRDLRQLL